jgi:glucose/arabinose dehydrogenase
MQKLTLFGKILPIFAIIALGATGLFAQSPKIGLTQFATGFVKPVDIAHIPNDSRLFIVEQDGKIWILDSAGTKQTTVFLDINARVNSNGNEQGLLGLDLHPNFLQNGLFFVNYTQNNGDTRVSRFTATTPTASPLVADPASEVILFEVDQPYSNHNGGCVKFGPDGYLYVSLGDGGSGGDPQGNGQKKSTMLGKILRIDVDNPSGNLQYSIPADNPFVSQSDYLPEIWSLGLRNVWKFSFDRLNGDMWLADVGQNIWEEVNYEPANTGGRNYGWRCYEGDATYNTAQCQPASAYQAPVFVYNHTNSNGCSITGGYVYRGSKYPLLYGQYLVADYCSGRFWRLSRNADATYTSTVLSNFSAYEYSAFGEDKTGELYVAMLSSGRIMRVEELCSSLKMNPDVTNTCPGVNSGSIFLSLSGGTAPYTYSWSGGTNTGTASNLASGTYTVLVKDANACELRDTFTVSEFPALAPVSISITTGAAIMCPDDTTSVVLTAGVPPSLPASFQWSNGGTPINGATGLTYTLAPQSGGSFTVQWKNLTTGCLSEPSPVQTIGNEVFLANILVASDGFIRLLDTMNLPAGMTFQWYYQGQPIAGSNTPIIALGAPGEYSVSAISANGCVTPFSLVVNTRDLASLRTLDISPNPSTGWFRVLASFDNTEDIQLNVLDQQGRLVHRQGFSGKQINYGFDLGGSPAGTYTLVLMGKNGSAVRQLVVN